MSDYAAIVPAEDSMAGVPAYEQISTPAQPTKHQQPVSNGMGRGNQKYRLKMGRRGQDDRWPGFTGDEPFDVERLWLWVRRGAHKLSQRRCNWKGGKMDVAQAYELMQHEKRALMLEQQRLEQLSVSMKVGYGMSQPANYLQDSGSGYQNPFRQSLQTSVPVQQGPFSTGHSAEYPREWDSVYQGSSLQHMQVCMSTQQCPVGVPQHAENLQRQGWDQYKPSLQQMQVSQPALQVQLRAGHSTETLPALSQQCNPAVYPPLPLSAPVANMSRQDSGFSGITGGLQSQPYSSHKAPSNMDLYADDSIVHFPSAPVAIRGLPSQFSRYTAGMDFAGMGAWSHQPALDAEQLLSSNAGLDDFAAYEGPKLDFEAAPTPGDPKNPPRRRLVVV